MRFLSAIFAFVVFGFTAYGQNDFFIYQIKGEPYLEVNDSIKSASKGSLLTNGTDLIMNRDDEVQFINEQGDIFELISTGTFNHKDLMTVPAKENNSSFSRKVFSFVWKEFTNNIAFYNNKSGVVYRGDEYPPMIIPSGNASILSDEIQFEWRPLKDKKKNYYLLLKDVTSGNITTIGTPSTALFLTVDNNLLKPGTTYEWTITETRLPNMEKLEFRSFDILSPEDLRSKASEIKNLNASLFKLGFTRDEIRRILCEDYKLCY